MQIEDVEAIFRAYCTEIVGFECEVGRWKGTPYLRIFDGTDPDRWANISTSGDVWFEVGVNGGFGHLYVEEEIEDDDLRAVLAQFVEIGLAYLTATREENTPVGKRFPVIAVATPSGNVELRRTVAMDIRELFRFRR